MYDPATDKFTCKAQTRVGGDHRHQHHECLRLRRLHLGRHQSPAPMATARAPTSHRLTSLHRRHGDRSHSGGGRAPTRSLPGSSTRSDSCRRVPHRGRGLPLVLLRQPGRAPAPATPRSPPVPEHRRAMPPPATAAALRLQRPGTRGGDADDATRRRRSRQPRHRARPSPHAAPRRDSKRRRQRPRGRPPPPRRQPRRRPRQHPPAPSRRRERPHRPSPPRRCSTATPTATRSSTPDRDRRRPRRRAPPTGRGRSRLVGLDDAAGGARTNNAAGGSCGGTRAIAISRSPAQRGLTRRTRSKGPAPSPLPPPGRSPIPDRLPAERRCHLRRLDASHQRERPTSVAIHRRQYGSTGYELMLRPPPPDKFTCKAQTAS